MKAIMRDVVKHYHRIRFSHESITDYIVAEWGMGLRTAELIEDWYWRRYR